MQKRRVARIRARPVKASQNFSILIGGSASSVCAYPTLTLMERVSEYLDRYKQVQKAESPGS